MERLENNIGRGENMRETIEAQPKRKLPGTAVAEYSLWKSRIDQSTGQEVGVRNPEGEYTDLQQGEHFAIEKDFENRTFKAVVKDSTGRMLRILGEGNLPIKEHGEAVKKAEASEIQNTREQLGLSQEVTAETLEAVKERLENLWANWKKIQDDPELTGLFSRKQKFDFQREVKEILREHGYPERTKIADLKFLVSII